MDVLGRLCLDLAMYNSGLLRSQEWPLPDGLSWMHYCVFLCNISQTAGFLLRNKSLPNTLWPLITGAVRFVSSLESGYCIDT
jgi:hypothetical protein